MTKQEAQRINHIRAHAERLAELAETAVGILACYVYDNNVELKQFYEDMTVVEIEKIERQLRDLKQAYKRTVWEMHG